MVCRVTPTAVKCPETKFAKKKKKRKGKKGGCQSAYGNQIKFREQK